MNFAKALVDFFGENLTDSEKKIALEEMMYRGRKRVDLTVLQLIDQLDTENAQAFDRLKRAAMEDFEHLIKVRTKKQVQSEAKEKEENKKFEEDKAWMFLV